MSLPRDRRGDVILDLPAGNTVITYGFRHEERTAGGDRDEFCALLRELERNEHPNVAKVLLADKKTTVILREHPPLPLE
jgi:hypothetical protein